MGWRVFKGSLTVISLTDDVMVIVEIAFLFHWLMCVFDDSVFLQLNPFRLITISLESIYSLLTLVLALQVLPLVTDTHWLPLPGPRVKLPFNFTPIFSSRTHAWPSLGFQFLYHCSILLLSVELLEQEWSESAFSFSEDEVLGGHLFGECFGRSSISGAKGTFEGVKKIGFQQEPTSQPVLLVFQLYLLHLRLQQSIRLFFRSTYHTAGRVVHPSNLLYFSFRGLEPIFDGIGSHKIHPIQHQFRKFWLSVRV